MSIANDTTRGNLSSLGTVLSWSSQGCASEKSGAGFKRERAIMLSDGFDTANSNAGCRPPHSEDSSRHHHLDERRGSRIAIGSLGRSQSRSARLRRRQCCRTPVSGGCVVAVWERPSNPGRSENGVIHRSASTGSRALPSHCKYAQTC